MIKYDYLIVGAGLWGAVFAHAMTQRGFKCLVVERRNHVGGNLYCDEKEGIRIHQYGAHIFHTSNRAVWNYIRQFTEFNAFINTPIANYKGEIYNLPFNMNTFNKMWNVRTPAEAEDIINRQRSCIQHTPRQLEEQAISLVGTDIYERLIKGYTEKQWGRPCDQLPASIIKRIPVRFTYNNNYFSDPWQGIPTVGYNAVIAQMLDGSEVRLNVDYHLEKSKLDSIAHQVVYTGSIDAYFDYCYGPLPYRTVRFETVRLETPNAQGVAVVNYTDRETPYTRIIEHKHFEFGQQPVTYLSYEYPEEWQPGKEPYYPVRNKEGLALYQQYRQRASQTSTLFGGRLGEYQYYDMDATIASALASVKLLL